MASLKGSKTEDNLKAAFAGESQANRRYLYFAQKADVEGYNDVSAVFRSTAEGETGHAHGHLEYLEETGDPATGLPIGGTADNLKAAIAGETHEYTDMYPGMARTAREEGFDEIADWFETLAKAERRMPAASSGRSTAWRSRTRGVRRRTGAADHEGARRQQLSRPYSVARMPERPARGEHDARRQSRSADAARARVGRPGFHRSGQDRGGDAPHLRHLSRLPALLQPVRLVPAPVRPDRQFGDRRTRWRAGGRLPAGRRRLHAVRHVLHDEVPLCAAARVQPRFSARDAALPRGRARRKARCRWPATELGKTDRNGELAASSRRSPTGPATATTR